MALDSLREQAQQLVQTAEELTSPIAELTDDQWTRDVDLSAQHQQDIRDLGTVQLTGDLKAAISLTKRSTLPEDLDAIDADAEEDEQAVSSTVLVAEAGAELNHQQTVAAGAGVTLGADAAGRLAVGYHRRHLQSMSALEAFQDHFAHLRHPYSTDALGELTEGELFAVELSGHGQLSASAGWQIGLVRSFEGTDLERLIPGELGEVEAGVTAGVMVTARIEGEMRVLVDASPRDPRQVRVRLHRKHGNFVGAGLNITASVALTQAESFVNAAFARLLQLPDGFVADIEGLLGRLGELQTRLEALSDEARTEIADNAGVAQEALGLDDLERLRGQLEAVPRLAELLAPIFSGLDDVADFIDEARDDLVELVDETFETVTAPLDRLASSVEEWLDGYRQARQKALEHVIERAKQGITAELSAGINRARTTEALLELDFVLETAGLLCLEAMKGNFAPALERAQAPGATGVEIVTGLLKSSTKTDRFYSLRLNFFGFTASVDFRRWNEVTVEEDVAAGTLSISGRSGAQITAETNRRVNELSFIFDVYGGFERRGDEILTTVDTNYKAALSRSATFRDTARIRPLMRWHVEGARRLGLIGQERSDELIDALHGNSARSYDYTMRLAFPPSSFGRMFSLDLPVSDGTLRIRLWRLMREAVAALDIPIAHVHGPVPLSETILESTIEAVQLNPIIGPGGRLPAAFRGLRFENRLFQEGAQRQIFFYQRNAHFFIEAYLRARRHLLEGDRLQDVTKTLAGITADSVRGVGAIDLKPFDAKYLVFALAEGMREVEISMSFHRGSVDVTI